MGSEARRKELAGDLRRKIGGEAAAAVGELRELLEQTNKNMRAIAAGLAQCEKRLDLAAAAPAAIRQTVGEALGVLTEQVGALRLRVDSELVGARVSLREGANVEGALEKELDDLRGSLHRRVADLERWQSERHVMRNSIFVAHLVDAEARMFDERSALLYGRWAWLRPRRTQRVADLGRMLDVFVGVRLALGIALPTDRRRAKAETQQVVE